jgi:hypothetical protein
MNIRRTLFLTLILFGLAIPHNSFTFAQTPPPSECADGSDNDQDGGVDKNGKTAPDGFKYPPDKECLVAGAVCENGAKVCTSPAEATCGSGFCLKVKINNPLKVDTIQDAIELFMKAVLRIALPFIIVFFIWAGLSFVLARGNPEKIAKAKKMFWYTIIGALLILGAWTITNAIIGTVNSITG